MYKLLLIGLKDLKLMFRDRAALTFMLLAPFLLTVGMAFVTGRFSGASGLSGIGVVIVNQDQERLGNALSELFYEDELAELLEPGEAASPEAARQMVDADEAAAAVIIPSGFTRSIIPAQDTAFDKSYQPPDAVQIEFYANPTQPTNAGVIRTIIDEFLSRVEEQRVQGITTLTQLLAENLVGPQELGDITSDLFEQNGQPEDPSIRLRINAEGPASQPFDLLAYVAPGMALMFLMYTVSYGGRSILAERNQGTLPRLIISPTSAAQVLGGKTLGIFFMGVAQIGILILASALLFQVQWGDPLGMIVLILAAVFAASGWGLLITALARTPAQVANTGTAIMLIFGVLGGSFIQLDQMPSAFRIFSKITPNAWGLDGFSILALGGTLTDLVEPLAALMIMGTILFTAAVWLFSRKGLAQK